MTTYTNRRNTLAKETTFVLSETGIGDGESEWAYNELKEVRLKFVPTRHHGSIYECRISNGKGAVVLSNRRYKGPADFEYNNEGYTTFVKALHERLAQNGSVEFRTGKAKGAFWFELIASLVFFPLLLIAMFFFGQYLVGGVAALFILIRLTPYFLKNKPGSYTPGQIPDRLLP